MKYAVYTDERDDFECIHWFGTEPEAADFVKKLIVEAEAEAIELEGHLPSWINEVCILKVTGKVQDLLDGDGLRIVWS